MKVLFIARHFTYFRNFESVIAELAERGHQVHLAADREEALGGRAGERESVPPWRRRSLRGARLMPDPARETAGGAGA